MVVRIKLNKWIRLPRLGSGAFRDLMRAGVKYESGKGFLIPPQGDLERIKHIISGALKGAPVEIVHECAVCGKEITCKECEYYPSCMIENASPPCICHDCLEKITLEDYAKLWINKYKLK